MGDMVPGILRDAFDYVRHPSAHPLNVTQCQQQGCEKAATHFIDVGQRSQLLNGSYCREHGDALFEEHRQRYADR